MVLVSQKSVKLKQGFEENVKDKNETTDGNYARVPPKEPLQSERRLEDWYRQKCRQKRITEAVEAKTKRT